MYRSGKSPTARAHSIRVAEEAARRIAANYYTPEQRRDLPVKDRWTPEESLAIIKKIDGTDCIQGVPLPYYIDSRNDRVRWANCVRVAAQVFGDAVASPQVQQTARVLFVDRETFTD